jgi:hypothetical protein
MNTAMVWTACFHLDQHAHSMEVRYHNVRYTEIMAASQANYKPTFCPTWTTWSSSTDVTACMQWAWDSIQIAFH